MSQDHPSTPSRPSYEDPWAGGAADRPAYPPAPPARWGSRRLADGAATSAPPGRSKPAYGPPAPPPHDYGVPDAGRFVAGTDPLSTATTGGYGRPGAPGQGTAPAGGFGGPPAGGPPAGGPPAGGPTAGGPVGGGPVGGAYGTPPAGDFGGPARGGRFAPPEAPGHGADARSFRLGAPVAPVHGSPAPVAPVHGGPAPAGPVHGGTPSAAPGGYHAPDTSGYGVAGPARAAWSPGDAPEPTTDGSPNPAVHQQIRQAVVHRVQYANALHASHFWDLRRTSPVGPHALVFLYASLDPRFADPRRPYYEIKAASRLFRDGEEVQDLPALLAELCEIAEGYLAGGKVFDPVAQMTQAGEPMPAEARYVGVSVSSLLGGADEAGAALPGVGGMGIPGRNLVVMSDDNLLVVERPARAHEQVVVHSTAPHFSGGGVEVRTWLPLTGEQQVNPAWRSLRHLNQLVLAGQERKAAVVASMVGRRRR
ncbi:hypothetical protein [Micromonospora sp. NPDC004551]|uniref:hypothetical protein n=1 Tax=Micromonospora sp. NPDC004551 TaxID=3154284 RepID=UPI0033B80DAD